MDHQTSNNWITLTHNNWVYVNWCHWFYSRHILVFNCTHDQNFADGIMHYFKPDSILTFKYKNTNWYLRTWWFYAERHLSFDHLWILLNKSQSARHYCDVIFAWCKYNKYWNFCIAPKIRKTNFVLKEYMKKFASILVHLIATCDEESFSPIVLHYTGPELLSFHRINYNMQSNHFMFFFSTLYEFFSIYQHAAHFGDTTLFYSHKKISLFQLYLSQIYTWQIKGFTHCAVFSVSIFFKFNFFKSPCPFHQFPALDCCHLFLIVVDDRIQ